MNTLPSAQNFDPCERFQNIMREIVSDISPASILKIPDYFDPTYQQRVDGAPVWNYADFVLHMKALKSKLDEDFGASISWRKLVATDLQEYLPTSANDDSVSNHDEHRQVYHITSVHLVKAKVKDSGELIESLVIGLFQMDSETGRMLQCDELTRKLTGPAFAETYGSTQSLSECSQ